MMFRICVVLLVSVILAGCGTIKTVNPRDNHVEISENGGRSYCESIPRIYSGTSYHLCTLYGEPRVTWTRDAAMQGVFGLVVDGSLSLALDTLLLPYTVVRQTQEGNIAVNREMRQ